MIITASLSETWALSSNHSISFSKVTKNSSGPPGARRHLKRPRTHSHLQMYCFIMTPAFLLFLRAMQASMASEQSYFTASLMEMSDLSHMLPGPWTRLRKLGSDWEGRSCHYFWGHQILHVSLRTQVHSANWSQTPVENICSGFCDSSFGCC